MDKAVVLLSGGQDSTTCLAWAVQKFNLVTALSIFYGQRHAAELDAANQVAKHFGVRHIVQALPVLHDIGGSALVDTSVELAGEGGLVDAEMPQGLPTSFVPGRNILFLAVAAAYAVRLNAKHIVTGVCQTDYSGYPDCREDFVLSMQRAINDGMPSGCGPLIIDTPLMHLTKAETVQMAHRLPGAWEALGYSVTCYNGQRPGCGVCPACQLRQKGFEEAGLVDPAAAA